MIKYMLKSVSSSSVELDSFYKFKSKITRLGEIYVVGLFESENDELFKAYTAFSTKYSRDLEMFHTFKPKDFLNNLNSKRVRPPAIVVYYHEDVITEDKIPFSVLNEVKYIIKNILKMSQNFRLVIF